MFTLCQKCPCNVGKERINITCYIVSDIYLFPDTSHVEQTVDCRNTFQTKHNALLRYFSEKLSAQMIY